MATNIQSNPSGSIFSNLVIGAIGLGVLFPVVASQFSHFANFQMSAAATYALGVVGSGLTGFSVVRLILNRFFKDRHEETQKSIERQELLDKSEGQVITDTPTKKVQGEVISNGFLGLGKKTVKVTARIAQFNVGTNNDYSIKGGSVVDPREEGLSSKRADMLRQAVDNSGEGKITVLGLQEAFDFDIPTLKEKFPGFEFASAITIANRKAHDAVIGWDTNYFTQVGQPSLIDNDGNRVVVELQEKATGATFVVVSTHLTGFNLARNEGAEQGDEEMGAIIEHLELNHMDSPTFILMDANTTRDYKHSNRLSSLPGAGFIDLGNEDATIFDRNLNQPVTLDYVMGKGASGQSIQMKHIPTPEYLGVDATHVQNPSDHALVVTDVTFTTKV